MAINKANNQVFFLVSPIPSYPEVVWCVSFQTVLCSYKDRSRGEREFPHPQKNGITLAIRSCNLLFSFNNISKTFSISAHTFAAHFLNNNIVFDFIAVPWLIYPSLINWLLRWLRVFTIKKQCHIHWTYMLCPHSTISPDRFH